MHYEIILHFFFLAPGTSRTEPSPAVKQPCEVVGRQKRVFWYEVLHELANELSLDEVFWWWGHRYHEKYYAGDGSAAPNI